MKERMMGDSFVRVPFKREKDGTKTFFLPDCRSPSGYRVGPKGQVETLDDYWEALRRVMSFSPPHFRRANSNGNFGRVVCEPGDVEEVSRRHIESMISTIR
jgi:hypothetical protein